MPEQTTLVPIWPVFVVPALQALSDGKNWQRREIFDAVAKPQASAEKLAQKH